MVKYRVIFLVEQGSLTVLMGVLDNEKGIQLEELDLVKEVPEGQNVSRRRIQRGRIGPKLMHGDDLLREVTKGGAAVSREQLTEAMVKNGFAATGLSPLIHRGIKSKIVAWDKDGNLRRAVK